MTPEEIAKKIDPDNTFLFECEEVVKKIMNKVSVNRMSNIEKVKK